MGKAHETCCLLSNAHMFSMEVALAGRGQSCAGKNAKTVKVSATAGGCMSRGSDPVLFASVRKAQWPLSKLAVILLGFSICSLLLFRLCHAPCVHTPLTSPFYLSWLLGVKWTYLVHPTTVWGPQDLWDLWSNNFNLHPSSSILSFLFVPPRKYVMW